LGSKFHAKEHNRGHIMDGVLGAGQVLWFGVAAGFLDRGAWRMRELDEVLAEIAVDVAREHVKDRSFPPPRSDIVGIIAPCDEPFAIDANLC
jgi:hypothetical protein